MFSRLRSSHGGPPDRPFPAVCRNGSPRSPWLHSLGARQASSSGAQGESVIVPGLPRASCPCAPAMKGGTVPRLVSHPR
ncbi:hypothetical protein CLOP_g16304 [Closterium sp. NIES-67]|nr:hypothetical protein CLOP_g16304 [Closterium sp. NIES-67]